MKNNKKTNKKTNMTHSPKPVGTTPKNSRVVPTGATKQSSGTSPHNNKQNPAESHAGRQKPSSNNKFVTQYYNSEIATVDTIINTNKQWATNTKNNIVGTITIIIHTITTITLAGLIATGITLQQKIREAYTTINGESDGVITKLLSGSHNPTTAEYFNTIHYWYHHQWLITTIFIITPTLIATIIILVTHQTKKKLTN